MPRESWLAVQKPLPSARRWPLWALSFLLPLAVWSAVSYVPFLWHPMIKVETSGAVTWLKPGTLIEREQFAHQVEQAVAQGGEAPTGGRANPIYLPAPHRVGRALYTAFTTKPAIRADVWLHESLWSSIQTIFWGFTLSSLIGVPLGILCGSFASVSRVTEPFVDFVRYMPAPVFGALMVAVWGIYQEPKIAIIFIGTFFQQVLVVSNTVRKVDPALIEAAQTLGAKNRHLLMRVIVPASLPDLYNDLRILLGWAWTYLIVAEVIGVSSGITFFINQQAKYRNFENVYAAIFIIGLIGLLTDQVLGFVGARLFGWRTLKPSRLRTLWQRFFSDRYITLWPERVTRKGDV
ncbi:ABC transporter permease [Synoicihabitans lomoniglobus]|uniref:ABC transporter permease n=1 Tax=Synoicihabitans lomoniglobus TaxID=2909285 RepID=A0AAF0A0B8_9BACT|nr:ABC transporter permease [Opitutaceae bacterium LMO-M01]WED64903.1 ABC transporter permease [Opitutaceae bacterium LMO-M01]